MTVFFTSYSAPWPFFLQSILHTIPHTIPHTIYNTISHTIYSTILPTCSPTYAEPCGQSHYEVVQKKYVWTGAVRRCGASSRPRGLGGGPESPQEPQWDTAAATLGSGGEGGKWILDKFGRGHIQIFDRLSNLFNKAPIPRTKQSPQIQNNALKC